MNPLVVEVDGRVLRLEGDRTFRIGRSIEADIILTSGSSSRQHAEIRPIEGRWVLVDTGSQFGTFVDGRQIDEHPITERVVVTCGPDAAGAQLTIYPEDLAPSELADPSHAPAVPPMPVDSAAPTEVQPGWPQPGPQAGGPPAPAPAPPAPPPYDGPPPAPAGAQFAPPGEIAPPPAGGLPADLPPPAPGAAPSAPSPFAPGAPGGPGRPAPAQPAGLPMTQSTQVVMAGQGQQGYPGGPVMPPSGPDLLLVAEGKEHRFRHPTHITIGRNPESTVVLSDPAASRQHGQVAPVAGGWVYTNVSNEGTFADGRRITTKTFDERITLRLGHPVAGPEVALVPILSATEEEKRIARKRTRKRLSTIGAVAAALVLVAGIVGGAAWLFGRGDDGDDQTAGGGDKTSTSATATTDTLSTLTEEELDVAKSATVRITAESELDLTGQSVEYSGSGSIIREDGLILTNAHVATPGDEEVNEKYDIPDEQVVASPEYLTIAITDPDTGETEPTYRAEVVASDGELDAAVLQIVGDEDGEELDDPLDLPTVPVGESSEVEVDDEIRVLGFPGVSDSESISVTRGVIATVIDDRDEFDTDARISGGNSGGMAINLDGQLIGVPSYGRFDGRGGQSNRLKQIDALKDLIEEAEEAVD